MFPVTLYPPRQCHSQPNVLSRDLHYCGVSTKYRSKIMAGSKNATSTQGPGPTVSSSGTVREQLRSKAPTTTDGSGP